MAAVTRLARVTEFGHRLIHHGAGGHRCDQFEQRAPIHGRRRLINRRRYLKMRASRHATAALTPSLARMSFQVRDSSVSVLSMTAAISKACLSASSTPILE